MRAIKQTIWSQIGRWEIQALAIGSLAIVASRWFYQSQYLFHWDSVQFALALDKFDVIAHRPHPPGYIIYIWLGRMFQSFGLDANSALIAVGILATVAGLWGIFYFTKSAFGKTAAWIAAGLFLLNASVWFHGLVAEVYVVESVVVLFVVWLLYGYWRSPTLRGLILVAVGLGLLGGIRQTAEVTLLPLAIYALWSAKISRNHWLIFAGVLAGTNLVWLVPVVMSTGGLKYYLEALYQLSQIVIINAHKFRGVWGQIVENLKLQIESMRWVMLGEMIILFLGASPFLMRGGSKKYPVNWSAFWFWALAILPPLAIVSLTIMTNPGYVLSAIVLVLPLVAASILVVRDGLAQYRRSWGKIWLWLAVGGLFGYQLFNFYGLRPDAFEFINPALASVQRHDQRLTDIITTMQTASQGEPFAVWEKSANTIIFFGTRHFQYHLPEVDVYRGTPESFVHAPEDIIWHVRGSAVDEYVPTAELPSHLTKLFAVRDTWSQLHTQYEIPVPLPTGHFIIYYDLTDTNTRDYLTRFNFAFSQWPN